MTRTRWSVLAAMLLCVACSRQDDSPEAVAKRQTDAAATNMLVELSGAYRPYEACVTAALQSRQDFNGRLPEMIVQSGLGDSLQQISRRYLAQSADLAALDETARVAATRQTLLALGGFAAAPGQPPPEQVRRQMAMIEVMQVMASATSVQCSPSDNLLSWMERANNEYL
ncbi:hypothetical protein [Arenimonas terrae]|uniref:Uncharacterized protein n=1 Tax=Arenimonas terrae TaxID=2546226 RepID=A0A5C4RVB8_9GAMM|nr:hypothetical protein [Arenimonas terrae]TNJ35196.1 hypothetical protein E1B00_05390 [Arenimonas terrae]